MGRLEWPAFMGAGLQLARLPGVGAGMTGILEWGLGGIGGLVHAWADDGGLR